MIKTRSKTRRRLKDRKEAPLPRTEGLDPLDRERAASLADEGGSAAARVERMEPRAPSKRPNRQDEPLSKRPWILPTEGSA